MNSPAQIAGAPAAGVARSGQRPPGVARGGVHASVPAAAGGPKRPGGEAASEAAERERQRRQTDGAGFPVLPDCCNFGVILRVLGVVNAGMLLLALASTDSVGAAWSRMLTGAAIVEPAVLATLALLCPLRRLVNGAPRWMQLACGLGVAFAVTMVVALATAGTIAPELKGPGLFLWAMFCGLLAVGITFALIKWLYLRTLSLQPSQAEGRLQALQARIRPHFLFNSLNTVLGLMRNEPRQAERTLENLADLFRVFMKDSRELVPLDEEVLLCKEYLSIEKLRLTDRLSVAWHVDDMPGDALLPSLLLQPLVENAVHHGIEPRSEPGEVSITIAKSGERVRVDIVNPIAESAPTRPGNQMALSNIRERMSLTFDVEGSLVTVAEGGLFRATLVFPYRKERRRRDVKSHLDTDR